MQDLFVSPDTAGERLIVLTQAQWQDAARSGLSARDIQYLGRVGFKAKSGEIVILPEAGAVLGLGAGKSVFTLGKAPLSLPEGVWRVENLPESFDPTLAMTAWGLGAYQFNAYKDASRAPAQLVALEGADLAEVARVVDGVTLTRDLVNTPAGDMLPSDLEAAARALAARFGAGVHVTEGEDLLVENFPVIHAVGRAAEDAPRLIELEWGDPSHPRLALVGKGVCFDSGGLDIKPAEGMRNMKKDMGGAANILGLALMIMDANLPVRLHVLIPAVENAISGNAFRPGDILTARNGLTIEVDNTDAEGRLVLCDALVRAGEDEPDMLIDLATLTGAARIAMGPEVSPFYTDDEEFADGIAKAAQAVEDPAWRLPLWDGYDAQLEGAISDLSNMGEGPLGGSILAGLYLRRFVKTRRWVHGDIFAWTPKDRPGHPKGGNAQLSRALYHWLKTQYVKA
ncbi:leucyl aminopeptidase family protein [Woodsholea maritima]|uniref:leucyl aminopeptidase family protein n=1 Tax=Woodsholea maritima TaxID=240237 RepID=UPI00037314B7|nr:leucyl aminopeptidase family protein [Woodsholea maritima]